MKTPGEMNDDMEDGIRRVLYNGGSCSTHEQRALLDEVDRLRAALAQARADALGEAETVADGCFTGEAAAYRIRALQSTPPAIAPDDGCITMRVTREQYEMLRTGCPNCKSKERR